MSSLFIFNFFFFFKKHYFIVREEKILSFYILYIFFFTIFQIISLNCNFWSATFFTRLLIKIKLQNEDNYFNFIHCGWLNTCLLEGLCLSIKVNPTDEVKPISLNELDTSGSKINPRFRRSCKGNGYGCTWGNQCCSDYIRINSVLLI
ncbi:hypothetical protein Mgra_00001041 [Meloidogyne graminicola]|uniref:Uncharacterized protein n=1 Tax=Meloidogyne graminicola TaxID=189291 RepID=A0A8T0A2Z4_9BILA|nr:hypothetical protein Mgra_00001041 [Meloidogyne graminicola]